MSKSCHALPKHVRLARDIVAGLGASDILVQTHPHFDVSWNLGGVRMHLRLPHSASGNTVVEVRARARRMVRQHGLAVPA